MAAATGCVAEQEPPQCRAPAPRLDPAYTALALEVWPEDLVTSKCLAQVGRVRVMTAPLAEVQDRWCGPNSGGCYSTCGGDPVVAINDEGSIPHELTHWLYDCSGLCADNWNHDEELFQDTIEGIRAALAVP